MNRYLKIFNDNIANARSLSSIYINLRDNVGIEEKYTNNLLKAQLINVVSAFDMFIHNIIKEGVTEIFTKKRKETPKFQAFSFQAKTILALLKVTTPGFIPTTPDEIPEAILGKDLSNKLSYMSFQHPDKVVDALSLIWDEKHKIQTLAVDIGIPGATDNDKATNLRQQLETIIQRRNQIAHEGDIDPTTLQPRTIDIAHVRDATNFIESLGNSIFKKVTSTECYNKQNQLSQGLPK